MAVARPLGGRPKLPGVRRETVQVMVLPETRDRLEREATAACLPLSAYCGRLLGDPDLPADYDAPLDAA